MHISSRSGVAGAKKDRIAPSPPPPIRRSYFEINCTVNSGIHAAQRERERKRKRRGDEDVSFLLFLIFIKSDGAALEGRRRRKIIRNSRQPHAEIIREPSRSTVVPIPFSIWSPCCFVQALFSPLHKIYIYLFKDHSLCVQSLSTSSPFPSRPSRCLAENV